MTKKEVFQLLDLIAEFYEQFEVEQKKVDAWFEVLRSFPFDRAKKKVLSLAAASPYSPKISDLVAAKETTNRYIPDLEETHTILNNKPKPATEAVIQEELAKMRDILGIRKD
ncbi:hypothetical protein [Peribacillus sp. SCS-155]|uniref:hypothetical protein n=1 Tax=Peribacillus sedimenti TaxID=3115297 RepID=UPI0039065846